MVGRGWSCLKCSPGARSFIAHVRALFSVTNYSIIWLSGIGQEGRQHTQIVCLSMAVVWGFLFCFWEGDITVSTNNVEFVTVWTNSIENITVSTNNVAYVKVWTNSVKNVT